MDESRGPLIRRYEGLAALSEAAAGEIVRAAKESSGKFSICLSGGSTPRELYTLLSTKFRDDVPWDRAHLFLGDERWVERSDPQSNWRTISETLLRDNRVGVENLHPIPGPPLAPDAAAQSYESTLRAFFGGPPRFDVLLLGLGPDGHTASLFPGTSALEERSKYVVAIPPSGSRLPRISLTAPALNSAKRIFFLVAGADKRGALAHVLHRSESKESLLPAQLIRREPGVIWFVDASAAPVSA